MKIRISIISICLTAIFFLQGCGISYTSTPLEDEGSPQVEEATVGTIPDTEDADVKNEEPVLEEDRSYSIPDGMSALSVPERYLNGVDYLNPGDVVDIIASAKSIKAAQDGVFYYRSNDTEAGLAPSMQAYLAKNVTVLELSHSEREGESFAVLCVNEDLAKMIAEVEQTSELTFVLKSRCEEKPFQISAPSIEKVETEFTYNDPNQIIIVRPQYPKPDIPSYQPILPSQSVVIG